MNGKKYNCGNDILKYWRVVDVEMKANLQYIVSDIFIRDYLLSIYHKNECDPSFVSIERIRAAFFLLFTTLEQTQNTNEKKNRRNNEIIYDCVICQFRFLFILFIYFLLNWLQSIHILNDCTESLPKCHNIIISYIWKYKIHTQAHAEREKDSNKRKK